jgi:hypothetical protein
MKPGRRKECQGGIEPARGREPTVEHRNVIKDVQYCSRCLEGDPPTFIFLCTSGVSSRQMAANAGR